LTEHYDPAYDSSVSRHNRPVLAAIDQPDCSAKRIETSAAAILALPTKQKVG